MTPSPEDRLPEHNLMDGLDGLLQAAGMLIGMRNALIEGGFSPDIADEMVLSILNGSVSGPTGDGI